MAETVGEIVIPAKDGEIRAVLTTDGRWECPDPVILGVLRREFGLDGWYGSPSMGAGGAAALHAAAEYLGGEASYQHKQIPEPPPGVVF